ncbi:MAG: hypothetical protein NTW28_06715, partial [Candidatus Solibacter sp.]|nr:hypothetical protein [Candidatus Solibacter sp.]
MTSCSTRMVRAGAQSGAYWASWAEGWGGELFDNFGTSGEGQSVAAGAADQHHLGAEIEHLGGRRRGVLGEGDQKQVELHGSAAHEVVHADGAAVGEREGEVGAGHEDARFAGGAAPGAVPGKDADAAIGDGEEEILRVSGGRA